MVGVHRDGGCADLGDDKGKLFALGILRLELGLRVMELLGYVVEIIGKRQSRIVPAQALFRR